LGGEESLLEEVLQIFLVDIFQSLDLILLPCEPVEMSLDLPSKTTVLFAQCFVLLDEVGVDSLFMCVEFFVR